LALGEPEFGGSLDAGGSSAGLDSNGAVTTFLQFGHRADLPANFSGIRKMQLQFGHEN
jgi:hypothetical protein